MKKSEPLGSGFLCRLFEPTLQQLHKQRGLLDGVEMADIRHLQALAGGDGVAKCLTHLRKQRSGLRAPHDASGYPEPGKARRRQIRPLALAQLLGQACGLRQLGLLPLEGLRGKVAWAPPEPSIRVATASCSCPAST